MSINNVTISGNLGKDPELRKTQGGMAVLNFSLAVSDRRHNKQTDEWEDYVNWVPCTMFGKRAESVSDYISKGSKVAITGKLRYESWKDKEGNNRSKLYVIVDDLEFMSRKEGGSNVSNQQQATSDVIEIEPSVFDSDIPFGG